MTTHRHVLLPLQRTQRVSPVGLRGTLNWLGFSGFATLETSAEDDGWTTHVLVPGPYAHNLFLEGEAPVGDRAFSRMEVAAGDTPKAVQCGDTSDEVFFYISISKAAYPALLDELTERLHQIMVVRTETISTREG
ncbi:MAG: hypothetical protein ACPGU1_06495 [Myxococcota bacterium]